MTRYIYIILLIALIGCSENGMNDAQSGHHPIYLAASVANSEPTTRAPYELTAPTTTTPLNVAVWASTTPYSFPDNGKNGDDADGGIVELHTNARFQSSSPQLLNQAIYNKNTQQRVYFVSMHPESGWTSNANHNQAQFTFNGSQDLLFAPQISGTYATEYDKTPQLHFSHLLTWLSFEIKAETEDAITAWGKIEKIEIKSNTKAIIDLSVDSYTESTVGDVTTYTYNKQSGVEFTAEGMLPLYYQDQQPTDTTFEAQFSSTGGYELDTNVKEIAYVMCAPVEGSYTNSMDELTDEYTLTIYTEKRTIAIGLDLKIASGDTSECYYTGSTMGRQFKFLLNFRLGDTIAVSATMNDWEAGGFINKDIKE